MTATTSAGPRERGTEETDYQRLVTSTRNAIGWPLFTTDVVGLYDAFLEAIPASRRQHYHCRTCRHFVERFGGLVTIDEIGEASPVLWSDRSAVFFVHAMFNLNQKIAAARVTGVFLASDPVWGVASNTSLKHNIEWHHLHIKPTSEMVHRPSALKTSAQAAAEKLEDHGILCRGLAEFPIEIVRQAHTLLTTGGLYRSEKCIGVAKWLLDLHEALAATKHKALRENLIWRAVATAPPGFCHIRSTMITTLLEDLVAGKAFEEIRSAFDAKMSPIQYQRPQAAPTDGQLAAAEAVVGKLASAGALARRFAVLEEVLPHAIWTPKSVVPIKEDGVFGHLKATAAKKSIDVPAQPMTWDKFTWTVLPTAERVEFLVPHASASFFAFVTATDPSAPPILQWDSEEKRNPVSWYLYHGGSRGRVWNLAEGMFCDVVAITMQPSGWNGELAHQGDGAYLILRGARDLNSERAGLGLFPEILKTEYRSIRAAMEAFSRSREIDGKDTASACGIALQKSNQMWNQTVRVTVKGARVLYRLDRWD